MNLRNLARGRACQVRLPCCTGGGETTVLAHYRMAGFCGVALKPPDWMGAWACVKCHDVIDGRAKLPDYTNVEIRHAHAHGVLRTLAALIEAGKVKV